jgi:cobalt-zinc-cadmium efflux system protein
MTGCDRHDTEHTGTHAIRGPSGVSATTPAKRRESRLLFAAVLTTTTMLAEAIGGVVSGSLALLADAGHMLVDASALALAWIGARIARRPADARRSYGYGRVEVLAGFVNALTMFVLAGWIIWEAVERIRQPSPILSGVMLGVALAGLMVNLLVLRVLGGHGHSHSHDGHDHAGDDVNLQGARLHVIGDLLGSLAAVAAALIVRYTGWSIADPLLSVLVAVLILASAWSLLRRCAHILLEGTPEGLDLQQLEDAVRSSHGDIRGVHHVHVWSVTGGERMATLHLDLAEAGDARAAASAARAVLRERFGVGHVTIQVDVMGDCAAPDCQSPH